MAEAALPIMPLDDTARDGELRVVGNGEHFALARFTDEGWKFNSGLPLDFDPIGYYRPRAG